MRQKSLALDKALLKFTDSGYQFEGYASVFGGVDSYGDTVFKGAYSSTLSSRQRPIALRWNHRGPVIGKWLEAKEDEKGLFVRGELTKGHSVAEDVYASLKHEAVTGLSIGYYPVKYEENANGGLDLKEIELVEISVVETPADISAQVSGVKSALEAAETLKDIEAILRDTGGFTRTEAQTLISRIKSFGLRDSGTKIKPAEIAAIFEQVRI